MLSSPDIGASDTLVRAGLRPRIEFPADEGEGDDLTGNVMESTTVTMEDPVATMEAT